MRGYFMVTLRWIDSDWVLCDAVLDFKYFPSPHDQWTNSELILDIVKEFNLTSRIREIIADCGSEMAPAMKRVRDFLNNENQLHLEEYWQVRCIWHIINRSSIDATALMTEEIASLRQLLKLARNTVVMRELFGELSVTPGITKEKATVPNLDVENRWNSMFNMIDACFKFEKAFEALCNHEKLSVRLQD
jgi:hypothetical protein